MIKKSSNLSNIIAVIPARMGSSRFPGKPLAKIAGVPMIEHVYRRAKTCRDLEDVFIATCDEVIMNYCENREMNCIMTKVSHERASDRAAEAMQKIERQRKKKVSILVMLQGDEPLVTKEMIRAAIKPLKQNKKILVSNLYDVIKTKKEFNDPNEVKVVLNKKSEAMYFSREAIPSSAKYSKKYMAFKQVCVIPFQREFLLQFNRMKQTPMEIIESVDMMRCLENGYTVAMVKSPQESYSVDTRTDLLKVQKIMKKDPLFLKGYQL